MAGWVPVAALLLLLGSPGRPQDPFEDSDLAEVVEEVVKVEHVAPLGGWREIPADGQTAQEMARFFETDYNSGKDGGLGYQAVQILRAEMQVVNGFNYHIVVVMEKPGCSEGQEGVVGCQPDPSKTEVLECDVLIYVHLQPEEKRLVNHTCNPKK